MNEKDVDDAEELIKTHKILITTMMIKPNVALHALKTGKKNNRKIFINNVCSLIQQNFFKIQK